ncbi:MAG: hypothetical protein R3E79_44820 [Caldilineaceae bacterium]
MPASPLCPRQGLSVLNVASTDWRELSADDLRLRSTPWAIC